MSNRYFDVHPDDMDPDTGRPYAGYSSPSLDTSMHDAEMALDEGGCPSVNEAIRAIANARIAKVTGA